MWFQVFGSKQAGRPGGGAQMDLVGWAPKGWRPVEFGLGFWVCFELGNFDPN